MGSHNKLLIEVAGKPIIGHTVDAVIGSRATHTTVVTGHQRSALQRAVRGRRVRLVHNANYRQGLSSSLRCGLATLSRRFDAVLICLGDMPLVTSADLNRIMTAFRRLPHPAVCFPTFRKARGNPVILPRALLPEPAQLQGDIGAKRWITQQRLPSHGVEMKTDAVLIDIDSPLALYRLRRRLSSARRPAGPSRPRHRH